MASVGWTVGYSLLTFNNDLYAWGYWKAVLWCHAAEGGVQSVLLVVGRPITLLMMTYGDISVSPPAENSIVSGVAPFTLFGAHCLPSGSLP